MELEPRLARITTTGTTGRDVPNRTRYYTEHEYLFTSVFKHYNNNVMDTGDKDRYKPHLYLAARRNDPEARKQAQEDARRIARVLTEKYGVEVYCIGSLFDPDRPFSRKSDIDLVVKDLPQERFFSISAEAQELTDFHLDIIPYEDANDLILETVAEKGVRL
jgi:predicted nucleotidyltransferase